MRRRSLWRDPDFLKLWTGQAVSQLGSWITLIGLPLTAVLVLRASPLQMGILSGVSAAAVLLFSLFAGAWADRLRRRPILISADLGRTAVLGTIPLAFALHRLTMSHLYLVAATSAVLTVFFDVSYQAYLPSLVDRENLLEGNSKLALSESIAGVAGPGLTGILVQALTAPIAILFDAVSFLASAFSIWLIRKPEPRPERGAAPHIGREILEGLQASWREPVLRTLALRTATSSLFLGFGNSLYFLFAIRELGLSAALLSAIIAVGGASGLLGTLAAERLARRYGLGPALNWGCRLGWSRRPAAAGGARTGPGVRGYPGRGAIVRCGLAGLLHQRVEPAPSDRAEPPAGPRERRHASPVSRYSAGGSAGRRPPGGGDRGAARLARGRLGISALDVVAGLLARTPLAGGPTGVFLYLTIKWDSPHNRVRSLHLNAK
jgi:hypothetical protein